MAERTTQSWTTVPHFFLVREVDARALNAAARKIRGIGGAANSGVKITHTDLLIALVARVLLQHPRLNASYTPAGIQLHPEVNIAIAIAVNDGVIAAVIPNAHTASLAEIATQRQELAQRAKAGKSRPQDLTGATFTISNLGMFQIDSFTAIIPPPQAAILAVGAIADRVVAVDGKPAVRSMYDHHPLQRPPRGGRRAWSAVPERSGASNRRTPKVSRLNVSTLDSAVPAALTAPAFPRKKPFYANLWVQVLIAIGLALLLGHFYPAKAVAMKPLGDAFIRLISMVITLIIFCTVVSGIAGVQDIKKVGRVGGKALLYFEIVSTFALFIGLCVGNIVKPGAGIQRRSGYARRQSDCRLRGTSQGAGRYRISDAHHSHHGGGRICQRRHPAGAAGLDPFWIRAVRHRCASQAAVGFSGILDSRGIQNREHGDAIRAHRRVRGHGLHRWEIRIRRARSPAETDLWFFTLTCIAFVVVVLGAIAAMAGFGIFKFLGFIREEILIVAAVNASEAALPTLMEKLERLGCSRPLVGLVVPSGYIFNTDGTGLYMTLAALIRGPGDQYAFDVNAAVDDFRSGHAHFERRQRRAGSIVHRSGRHTHRGSDHSRCQHGPAARHRSLYEYRPRARST